jgi:hypothetical protein
MTSRIETHVSQRLRMASILGRKHRLQHRRHRQGVLVTPLPLTVRARGI